MTCRYCNLPAKHQLKSGAWCCEPKWNKCPAARKKNSEGLKKSYAEGKRPEPSWFDDTRAWNKGKTHRDDSRIRQTRTLTDAEIFCADSKARQAVMRERVRRDNLLPYICEKCGLKPEWNGQPLVLHIDHRNGNNRDHRLENIRHLCPNCHSQTDTYAGRNIKMLA